MQHYLFFYLAFEIKTWMITLPKKLWGPFEAGVVPCPGAPNVHDHVPPHSIIAVKTFDSIPRLAAYLQSGLTRPCTKSMVAERSVALSFT
jgi:hypothetical protein